MLVKDVIPGMYMFKTHQAFFLNGETYTVFCLVTNVDVSDCHCTLHGIVHYKNQIVDTAQCARYQKVFTARVDDVLTWTLVQDTW